MIKSQQEQLSQEVPLIEEMMQLSPVTLELNNDADSIQSRLLDLLGHDTEKLEFFVKNTLSDESKLVIVRIEGVDYLAVRVFNKALGIEMILPINTISISNELDDLFKLGEFTVEEQKMRVDYNSILFGYNGQYYRSVNPSIHSGKFISTGKKDIMKRSGEIIDDKKFVTVEDQFNDDSNNLAFNISLPINQETILSQLHELGHYIHLRIACNTVKVTRKFKLLLALFKTGGYISDNSALDITSLESLRNLKQAEISGWLYSSYFLRLLGSNIDLLNSTECIKALQTYDRMLAHQVLSTDVEGNISEYFIFPQTITETREWMQIFEIMTSQLSKLAFYRVTDIFIDSLGVNVKIKPQNIEVSGDDVKLTIYLRTFDEDDKNKWIDISWEKLTNGELIKKKYYLSLNNYHKALSEIGISTFLGWAEILEDILRVIPISIN